MRLPVLAILTVSAAALLHAQATPDSSRAGDWRSYDGQLTGNRYSELNQISLAKISALSLAWSLPIANPGDLEVTPLVIDGVMYTTGVNQVFALNAATGAQLWHYSRPQSSGLIDDAAGGINRGVAIAGNYIILASDNAHLIALDRFTGALIWETVMADSTQNYGSTGAPLVVNDVVVMGHSGGDEGVRGFVAGYKVQTGKRLWTLWTVPEPGDPAAATWIGTDLPHGGGSTWMTGTYDAASDIVYWTTGNPCPDFDGDNRMGDNLYTDSVLAIKPQTGQMLWHYQFTPHDQFDFDAQQTPMLVDAVFNGQNRKLLLQTSRNGFFYVLDRLTGEFLRATPFVTDLTWASKIDATGRPVLKSGETPSTSGTTVCPSPGGATNWMSNSFSPATGFYYVMATESCAFYTKYPAYFVPGQVEYGGDVYSSPAVKHVRALNLRTGAIAWDKLLSGPGATASGVLATAGGVVFYGDDNGNFTAADALSGRTVWSWVANQSWHASPMTYMVNGKQYVAIAATGQLMVFTLK